MRPTLPYRFKATPTSRETFRLEPIFGKNVLTACQVTFSHSFSKNTPSPLWEIYTITLQHAPNKLNPGLDIVCIEYIRSVQRIADIYVDDKYMWLSTHLNVNANDDDFHLMIASQHTT